MTVSLPSPSVSLSTARGEAILQSSLDVVCWFHGRSPDFLNTPGLPWSSHVSHNAAWHLADLPQSSESIPEQTGIASPNAEPTPLKELPKVVRKVCFILGNKLAVTRGELCHVPLAETSP